MRVFSIPFVPHLLGSQLAALSCGKGAVRRGMVFVRGGVSRCESARIEDCAISEVPMPGDAVVARTGISVPDRRSRPTLSGTEGKQ